MDSAIADTASWMTVHSGAMLVYLGAALAAALAGIGSAIGCGIAGQSGAGVLSESPDRFGNMLILSALPGTQGIYGFVIAFLALQELDAGAADLLGGLEVLFACIPIGLAGMLSGIHQGRVCAAGANLVAKRPDQFGRALVLGVIVEFYAILGFIVSFLVLGRIEFGG